MSQMAFLFPGQGSQTVGMGKDFYESSSLAREIFSRADESLGYSITDLCLEGPEDDLKLTQNTQPALLTVSTIAYKLFGQEPQIAAGHSLGEYSALVAAGAVSFEEAVLLVHKRGKYMQEAVPVGVGAMAAVLGVPYEKVEEVVQSIKSGVVEVANWNSKEQIVIAGDALAVKEALSLLNPPRSVMLPVSAPFHCRLMESAEVKLSYDLNQIEFKKLKFPVITNVDAKIILDGDQARNSLKRQVTRTVLWYNSMELMGKKNIDLFVEIGAGKVLSGLTKRNSREWSKSPIVLNVEDMESLEKTNQALSEL
ncbi:MAG: ACP S-malonyltransferase [Candidatus Aminicenantes bacterium]|nr:ACP S-malonyltransferase [Candidatus Aminicenantes bacterium]